MATSSISEPSATRASDNICCRLDFSKIWERDLLGLTYSPSIEEVAILNLYKRLQLSVDGIPIFGLDLSHFTCDQLTKGSLRSLDLHAAIKI